MVNLMETKQLLRAPAQAIEALTPKANADGAKPSKAYTEAMNQVAKRLELGYTLARWRCETGEETVAYNRGPLVPQQVPWPPVLDWPGSSNTSKEYQILDKKTGIMDLSYSSAWQLGKVLAISDTAFNAALMRFRSFVHNKAASRARKDANNVPSSNVVIAAFAKDIGAIRAVTSGETGAPQRIPSANTDKLVTSLDDLKTAEAFRKHLGTIVDFQGGAGTELYDEFNKTGANNSDWVTVFTWLSEKLYLSGIPAHFLIPDPSYLPSEALRFFCIDDAWLDCLIDGALSVANHLERDDDSTRRQIKQVFNVYLQKFVTDTSTKPQIPCSGFILKSALVKVMPDLRIKVTWKVPDSKRKEVCRYTKLDDTTILCLLDRFPEELENIELAQPPHQQRFSLGYAIKPKEKAMEFKIRQLYTKTKKVNESWPPVPNARQPGAAQSSQWFNFESRCVDAVKMSKGKITTCPSVGDADHLVPAQRST